MALEAPLPVGMETQPHQREGWSVTIGGDGSSKRTMNQRPSEQRRCHSLTGSDKRTRQGAMG